ncbi:glycosyltransferase [Cochlodiniinecator piscidefendens]|uniref:glycosyltransferase n=1 Tax=Cochlodiniinecator piscidefendens TaxID=2715756 RepID=UPI00140B5C9C|nr:glycosyltransferase [Cochlodiniinecator piscidefendens]
MELKKLEFTSCRRTSHDDLPGETADERLGQALIRMGALTPEAYDAARAIHRRQDCVFSQTLFARGYVTKSELRAALEQIWNCQTVDLETSPPDPRLMQQLGHATCLKYKILPWKSLSGGTVFATSDPQGFDAFLDVLPKEYGIPFLAIATEAQLIGTIQSHFEPQLTFGAETRVPEDESCRRWRKPFLSVGITAVLACLIAGLMLFPTLLLGVICAWAVFTLIASSSLKIAAAIMHKKPMRQTADPSAATPLASARIPCVSVLVPLFKEQEVATQLIARLQKLEYPRELLDICLIVENDDTLTKECIARSELPSWARVIVVPEGSIRTKPRALNYALDFCRGSIVGIYDAEDAPAHDQIKKIVEAFQNNGPEVACVQGVLDFYNARTNWLSRCFAIEYATWFRVILPGMLRLGLAIPLGGTTMFFRREAIEKLGGWDAHNVTEDADLGIRLPATGTPPNSSKRSLRKRQTAAIFHGSNNVHVG